MYFFPVRPAIPRLTAPPGYRPQADDTGVEADLLDFYLLRQRTQTERVRIAATLIHGARKLSLHCLKRQFSHLPFEQFARKVAETWLQEDCPANYIPKGNDMTWVQDSTELATQLHGIFAELSVPYYITGGVAAITYGEPRTTRDVDIVITLPTDQIGHLVSVLEQAGFYVSGVEDVLSGRMQTLQVTHIETISRADLVLARLDSYEQLKFNRRRLCPFPNGTEVYLASPEDMVVNKLRWGQQSQSEKQWRDVLGILKTQQDALDYGYIKQWAAHFDLTAAFEKAALEAGVKEIIDRQG